MTRGHLELREAGPWTAASLSAEQARWLVDQRIAEVRPGAVDGTFEVRAGNVVGVMTYGDLQISISPKLPVGSVVWMITRSLGRVDWWRSTAHLAGTDLTCAMAEVYRMAVEEALGGGLLRGYHRVDETDVVLRGRLRLGDQLARHHGRLHPLEIDYEEFDTDVAENRILLSAAYLLLDVVDASGAAQETRDVLRSRLLRLIRRFHGVRPLVPGEPRPTWSISRLNARYAEALTLADLVLGRSGLQVEEGTYVGRGMLVSMPQLFEDLVGRVLTDVMPRGAVRLQDRFALTAGAGPPIRPDICIHDHSGLVAVMDTKYKVPEPTVADLYQLNAYADVLGLRDVSLVYAEPVKPRVLEIAGSGTRIHLRGVDLAVSPERVVEQIRRLASHPAGDQRT